MIRREEIIERFESKCMDVPFAGCRIWLGTVNENGYGTVCVEGRKIKAHRFSWSLENGEVPVGIAVLHRCDTPSCVNPNHLFLGSQRDNMVDMSAKGRARGGGPSGERHPGSKLRAADIRKIRELARKQSHASIAEQYGIHRSNVGLIVSRKAWAHVD